MHILIADDHVIIRTGLKFLLNEHFAGCRITEADSVKAMMKLLTEHSFTHLILDMQLLDANIMDVFPKLVQQYPSLPALIYTMSPEEIFGKRMIQMGASGFISKQSGEEEMIRALQLFFSGKRYVSARLHDLMTEDPVKRKADNPLEHLSERELSVMQYLLKGLGVKEISVAMDLKATTVATYKARIFDKLGVTNMMDLRNIAEIYQFRNSQV